MILLASGKKKRLKAAGLSHIKYGISGKLLALP